MEWSGFELHPETPAGGISTADLLRHVNLNEMHARLAARAEEYGLTIRPAKRMPNTRAALHAAEYARDHSRFDELHTLLFKAHFEDLLDIEDAAVLRRLAEQATLDPDDMMAAVADDRYRARLDRVREEARTLGLTGVPLFLVKRPADPGFTKLIGARPIDDFRRLLGSATL